MDRGARQSHFVSQSTNAPASLSGRLLADALLDFFPNLRTIFAGAAQAGSILKPLPAAAGKTPAPFGTVISGIPRTRAMCWFA